MKGQLNNQELSIFFEQLSMILRSGISALEGISIMKEDTTALEGRNILERICASLEETGFLYTALEESGVFPDYAVHMVEIGETAGKLDDVTLSLSLHYEREANLMDTIKSAITYPLILLGMMLLVIFVLVIKVMPVFEQVFLQLGASMTGFSAAILKMGQNFQTYSIVFVVLAACVAGGIFYICKSEKGRRRFFRFLETWGPTGKIVEKIGASRFADGMSLAFQSGLDPEESLLLVSRLTSHPGLKKKIQLVQEKISQGEDFSESFASSGIFTGLYSRMVIIGYRTGSMDKVMHRIALRYEDEIAEDIQEKINLLEPTMVAILSILVGLILLSVMLPLIGIMTNIG